MQCGSRVRGSKAEHIQLVEEFIRKVSEARVNELELRVLEALHAGYKLTDLKITEVITWTESNLQFYHQVKVEDKTTGKTI